MKKKILIAAAALGLFVAGIGASRWVTPTLNSPRTMDVSQPPSTAVDTSDYARTWKYIKQNHIDTQVKDEDLFYGSVAGLVEALDDPYSVFLPPKEAALDRSRMEGSFFGIGAELGLKEGRVTVIAPIADTPAAKAGLQAGDIIISVDGKETYRMKLTDVVILIRGEKGKPVKLMIYREGLKEPKEITVVRAEIVIHSVKWTPKKIGKKTFMVVTISSFIDDTAKLFDQAADEAKAANMNGMVVDLRNNPGGYLKSAIAISCNWVTAGPIVIMEPRDEPPQPLNCEAVDGTLWDMPTVVLVNKGSASASEIMAGALQDYGKAHVIGETTYGKGCGQSVIKYPDGAELRLTTFLWKTPKNRSINKTGIAPDETLKADADDVAHGKDVRLDRALKYLTDGR